TKMVLGAIAVSFLPVIFLFFVSYALLNRTLVLWFPRPLELATESSNYLINEIGRADANRMAEIAKQVATTGSRSNAQDAQEMIHEFDQAFERGADLAWEVSGNGQPVGVGVNSNFQLNSTSTQPAPNGQPVMPSLVGQMPSGAELWQYGGKYFIAGRAKD